MSTCRKKTSTGRTNTSTCRTNTSMCRKDTSTCRTNTFTCRKNTLTCRTNTFTCRKNTSMCRTNTSTCRKKTSADRKNTTTWKKTVSKQKSTTQKVSFEPISLRRLLASADEQARGQFFATLCRPRQADRQIHSPCGKVPRNPADKKGFARAALDDCGKRRKSPSLFRDETRSFTPEGTAILSKPLQPDARFFRTHLLLPLLTKKTFVLKEETWS
jgi:hypothetical protein